MIIKAVEKACVVAEMEENLGLTVTIICSDGVSPEEVAKVVIWEMYK